MSNEEQTTNEISPEELEQVSGGVNPQPLPPKIMYPQDPVAPISVIKTIIKTR